MQKPKQTPKKTKPKKAKTVTQPVAEAKKAKPRKKKVAPVAAPVEVSTVVSEVAPVAPAPVSLVSDYTASVPEVLTYDGSKPVALPEPSLWTRFWKALGFGA